MTYKIKPEQKALKKLLEDAVSRVYYATLHAAKVALLSKGIEI